MLRENKWKLLVTTLIALIPMLVGVILWDRLPDTVATHFNVSNEPDGWSSKWFAVFGLPGMLAGLHLFCLAITSADPKHKNIGKKPIGILFWIIPCVSLVACTLTYAISLGVRVNIGCVITLLLGVLFVVLGNQLPRARLNYTFGVRLPWTLHDEQNWNRTSRFAGWCLALGGVVLIATSFWANPWIVFAVVALIAAAPIVYSYVDYVRGKKE